MCYTNISRKLFLERITRNECISQRNGEKLRLTAAEPASLFLSQAILQVYNYQNVLRSFMETRRIRILRPPFRWLAQTEARLV